MAQHQIDYRKTLRSALRNKKLADALIDSVHDLQTFTVANGGTVVNQILSSAITRSVSSPHELSSTPRIGSEDVSSYRKVLRSALANKKLADDMLNIILELQNYAITADKQSTSITAVAEGSVKEVSSITCDSTANSTDGEYFDITAQSGTVYRVAIDTTGGSLSTPVDGGHTLVEVDISGAVTDAEVATAIAAALDGLADFDAPAPAAAIVLCTDVNFGATTIIDGGDIDGTNNWAIARSVEGIDSALNGKYFVLEDAGGTKAFWIDVDNSGTAAPVHGADQVVEITTITSGMTNIQVADAVYDAIIADSEFEAGSKAASPIVVVQNADVGYFGSVSAGDSGFTVSVSDYGSTAATQDQMVTQNVTPGATPFTTSNTQALTAALSHAALASDLINMIRELQVEFRNNKLGTCSGTLINDLLAL